MVVPDLTLVHKLLSEPTVCFGKSLNSELQLHAIGTDPAWFKNRWPPGQLTT